MYLEPLLLDAIGLAVGENIGIHRLEDHHSCENILVCQIDERHVGCASGPQGPGLTLHYV